MDFSNWKAHASSVGLIMTDPKGKSNKDKYEEVSADYNEAIGKLMQMEDDKKMHLKSYDKLAEKVKLLLASRIHYESIKDQVELSETCKTHLVECYVKSKYGRTKDVETDAMIKGTEMEEDGITLLSLNHRRMYKKNKEQLENEYVIGTPDVRCMPEIRTIESPWNEIIDTKLSWDQFTFEKNRISEMDARYYWQLQTYMYLDHAELGKIAYVLVNTPAFLIDKAVIRMKYNVPENTWQMAEDQIRKNMTFDDVHIRERLIMQECKRNDADINRIIQRVKACRIFLQQLDAIATWNVLSTELK